MSLLEQVNPDKNAFLTEKAKSLTPEKAAMINQTSDLLRIINQVLGHQVIPTKTAKKWSEHRTRLGDAQWGLTNIQGNVTEHIWANMIGKSIEGMLKKIKHSQPNGDWSVSEYEVDVRRDDNNVERIELAVLFVDGENQTDLTYRNGMPESLNININAGGLSDDVMAALKSKDTDDSELKDLIKGLIGVMSEKVAPAAVAAPKEATPHQKTKARKAKTVEAPQEPEAKEVLSNFDEDGDAFDDDGFDGSVPSPVSFE